MNTDENWIKSISGSSVNGIAPIFSVLNSIEIRIKNLGIGGRSLIHGLLFRFRRGIAFDLTEAFFDSLNPLFGVAAQFLIDRKRLR